MRQQHDFHIFSCWRLLLSIAVLFQLRCETDAQSTASLELASSESRVIYGSDERRDVYQVDNERLRAEALDSVVALIPRDSTLIDESGKLQLMQQPLYEARGVCREEPFALQPVDAFCSGVLISPELVLTAGHCVDSPEKCSNTTAVFNYAMATDSELSSITQDDVYGCEELVVHRFEDTLEYAIFKLDRPVVGHTPARLRYQQTPLEIGEAITVIGTPWGLPLKIDTGAWVRDNNASHTMFFTVDADSFEGGSGSGAFLQSSLELAGFYARGDIDSTEDAGCRLSHKCSHAGCSGEEFIYLFRALKGLCDSIPNHEFCSCGDKTCNAGEDSRNCPLDCGSICGDGTCNGLENPRSCPNDCGLCGNGICESTEELESNCCVDCGCLTGELCLGNHCALGSDRKSCQYPGLLETVDKVVLTDTLSQDSIEVTSEDAPTRFEQDVHAFVNQDETCFLIEPVHGDVTFTVQHTCGEPDSTPKSLEHTARYIKGWLEPGTYFLVVTGRDAEDPSYTLSVKRTQCSGGPSDKEGTGGCNYSGGGGPENLGLIKAITIAIYRWWGLGLDSM